MHHHLVTYLLPAFEHVGFLGYWLVFLASFLESVAFVGALIPGTIVVIFGGFIAAQGYLHFSTLVWFVTIGAVLGDGLSYYLGTKGARFFSHQNRFLKMSHIERGEAFFKRHGNKSVFLARFVGPIRPIVPFIAGLSGMELKSFVFWNITSAILWAIVNLLIGFFFGNALQSIESWLSRFGWFLVGLAILCGLIWLIIKKSRNFSVILKSFVVWVKDGVAHNVEIQKFVSKHAGLFDFLKKRLSRKKFSGLPLTMLGIAFAYILLLFIGIVQGVVTSAPIVDTDIGLEKLMLAFHDLDLIRIFLLITLLGNAWVILIGLIIASIIFYSWRKTIYVHALWLTVVGSQIFVLLGKALVHRVRPTGFPFYQELSFSFPSSHAAFAVTFFGFIMYIILKCCNRWRYRAITIFLGLLIMILVGLSRMYLGVHFFSDVIGGYLMGLLWLIVGITVTEWHISKPAK